MMVVEIIAGITFNSMALLADGWHMSTHVAAFLITALAYYFCRRHATDSRYSFGTGKMGVLGGFASAVVLSVAALLMAGESAHRFFAPLPIHFNQAIGVAAIVSIVAHDPNPVETYRELFLEHGELVHATVEVQRCREHEDSFAKA